jgi:tetratricopeptide (TPR) repeat protein
MLGRYPSAAEKFEEMIAIHETAVDVQAEAKPTAMANLGWTQFHQQKLLQAEATLRKALAGYEKIESDSWERYNTESMLGATLVALRKYDEAAKLLQDSYDKLALRHPGPGPAQGFTAEAKPGERILKLYENSGKTGKAAEWRQKMEDTKLAGVR